MAQLSGPGVDRQERHTAAACGDVLCEPMDAAATALALALVLSPDDVALLQDMASEPSRQEIKRRQNRESMRRTRQRKQKEMAFMRRCIADLENHVEQLKLRQESRGHGGPDGATAAVNAKLTGTVNTYRKLNQAYQELYGLADQLRDENYWLRRAIQTHDVAVRAISMAVQDVETAEQRERELYEFAWAEQLLPLLVQLYLPIGVNQFVSQSYDEIIKYVRLADEHPSKQPHHVLGWSDKRLIDDDWVYFMLTKAFPHEDIDSAMARTWAVASQSQKDTSFQPRAMRMRRLLEIDHNTVVFARNMFLPNDNVNHCTLLIIFRVPTAFGYLLGMRTVLEDRPELDQILREQTLRTGEPMQYVHWFYGLLFTRLPDADGFSVRLGGRIGHGCPAYASTVAMDALISVLQWEQHCIQPVWKLTA